MNKTFIGVVVALLLIITGGLYYFFSDTPAPSSNATVEEKKPQEGKVQFLGTNLTETKEGKTQWEINADQILAKADNKLIEFIKMQAQIYGTGEQGNIKLTANQGQMDQVSKMITLHGDIKAVSDKGAEFTADMVKWFTNEQRFAAEGNVQYRRQDVTIIGDKLESEQNFTKVRVTGNARAELRRGVHE